MKAAAVQRDLSEMKNSLAEISDLALSRNAKTSTPLSAHPSISDLKGLNSAEAISQLQKKIRSSIEDLVDKDGDGDGIVTFPDSTYSDAEADELDDVGQLVSAAGVIQSPHATVGSLSANGKVVDTVKFEEKRSKSQSKTKVVSDGFSSEQATMNTAEMKHLQAGDIDFKEAKAAAATRNRLEVDGVKTEENAAVIQEALSLRTGDITQQASNNVAAASIKVESDSFSADKRAITQSQQSQLKSSANGIISQEKHVSSASQSNYTMTHKGVSSSGSSMISSSQSSHYKLADIKLDDLKSLTADSDYREVEKAITKYSTVLSSFVATLQNDGNDNGVDKTMYLEKINEVMRGAWAVPAHGHQLGSKLSEYLRSSGGLDMLLTNCEQKDMRLQFSSAKLLEQCLTTENRDHVVDKGLDKVITVACACSKHSDKYNKRVGTGIMEHLCKHSEKTCSDVIKKGGLDAVLFECRNVDEVTLRHCASALANLSLYGGAENQAEMVGRKVPVWLFHLANNNDIRVKYYACLAIVVLAANKEIESEVIKTGCLDIIEPIVISNDPHDFARKNLVYARGQSKQWLKRLVPVLSSKCEEARNLAAFHFCMEAGVKSAQGMADIFGDIGAIEPLKMVASCPNAVASKFAAQTLRLIGETVPHKLSQQVPLWSVEDVQQWVKQIGFGGYVQQFEDSQVDGDLLLKLTEEDLRRDIGISNGILLKRFERELQNLKRLADYSSKDTEQVHEFLAEIGPEFCVYTYALLNAGIDRSTLVQLNEEILRLDCGITNSIHRMRIMSAVKRLETTLSSSEGLAKTLDVFVSYRRSNGSQLASLLKVHLQLRGFSVFIDVERLEAGKFDNGLLNSIRQAKNFVLVLTSNALHRCINDDECKDWVHREIVAALNANCKIIPILDQCFTWPEFEKLPEDMRTIAHFNGVQWIHDYQEACIEKLERFLRGEKNIDRMAAMTPGTPGSSVAFQRMFSNDSDYQTGASAAGVGSNSNLSTIGSSGQANHHHHQANRYGHSPSPARQLGSHLSPYSRGAPKKSLVTLPYRTQQMSLAQRAVSPLIGGSMQNMAPPSYVPPRRSSAAGFTNSSDGRSRLAVDGNYRSQSVDGLLEQGAEGQVSEGRIAEAAALVAAGSMALTNASSSTCTLQPDSAEDHGQLVSEAVQEMVTRREKSVQLPPPSAQHRKSRSLDHVLSKQTLAAIAASTNEPVEETQSMENLAVNKTLDRPFEPANLRRRSPEGGSSADEEHDQDDAENEIGGSSTAVRYRGDHVANQQRGGHMPSSKASSASLGSSGNTNNKTIFNRTMKKVRSLMKKP